MESLCAHTNKTQTGDAPIFPKLGEATLRVSVCLSVCRLHQPIDPSHVKSLFDKQLKLLTDSSLLPEMQHLKAMHRF